MTREEYGKRIQKRLQFDSALSGIARPVLRFRTRDGPSRVGQRLGAARPIARLQHGAHVDEQHRAQHPSQLHAPRAVPPDAAGTFRRRRKVNLAAIDVRRILKTCKKNDRMVLTATTWKATRSRRSRARMAGPRLRFAFGCCAPGGQWENASRRKMPANLSPASGFAFRGPLSSHPQLDSATNVYRLTQ